MFQLQAVEYHGGNRKIVNLPISRNLADARSIAWLEVRDNSAAVSCSVFSRGECIYYARKDGNEIKTTHYYVGEE